MSNRNVHFLEAIQLLFVNYFNFKRSQFRGAFWYIVLLSLIINILLPLCSYWMAPEILVTLTVFYYLIVFIPTLALNIRRLHDVNKSGWWLLIAFTGIGYFCSTVLVLLPLGANYYGEDVEAANPSMPPWLSQ